MQKEPVNLICAANSGYNLPLCVMLASVVEHFDPTRELVIHVISNDSTAQDRENVRKSVRLARPERDAVEVHWYSTDLAAMERLPSPPQSHISRDTYLRFAAPYLLPNCARAIYLDCDLVVVSDLAELYDSTAGSSTLLHAAHDLICPFVSSKQGVFDYVERGIPPQTRYFNAGVLVMDLQRWRDRDLTPAIFNYLEENGDRVSWTDQGALNALFHHEWTPLDPRWNQTTDVLFPELWIAGGHSREDWKQTLRDPFIVHYSGPKKPWQKGRVIPRYSYFYQCLEKTVYQGSLPHRPRLENILGRRAYFALWRLVRRLVRGRSLT